MNNIRQVLKKAINKLFFGRTLASKIRYSYIFVALPFVILLIFCISSIWASNKRFDAMISSTLMATEFGLDFKEKFDSETYLLIAGDTPYHESPLKNLLVDATKSVDRIMSVTESEENKQRLIYVQRYLANLGIYTKRIEDYLLEGDRYEECIEIWENDVQIVTELISATMSEYIYYEVLALQNSKTAYEKIYQSMINSLVVGFSVAAILIIALSYLIPRSITRPITEITKITDEVAKGNLEVHADEYSGSEAMILADSINVMIDKINTLLVQIKQEQLSLRKAEFELLQAQINPHFLYNTLDAIVWLAESNEQKKVVEMVGNLSSFFRTSLNQGREIVSIKDEVEHARSYLSIQKVRYQDILNYEINVCEEILDCEMPKLSIQPFVENALYHGIKEKRGGGTIVISGYVSEDNKAVIEVCDDGAGMSEERLEEVLFELEHPGEKERSIYGMYNVSQRVKLNYGREYGVEIESVAKVGTKARIVIPLKKQYIAIKAKKNSNI
ncbi:MAG: sensor histidine kinase [Lachnospiraceae bacterium]|nr:sensor histidine kinase [Lachnospiraceae bacterium]